MLYIKKAVILAALLSILPIYLLWGEHQIKTSNSKYQANKKRTIINNNVLDGNDKIDVVAKDVKKLLKTQSKNGDKIVNVKKVKNMTVNQYDESIHKTYQSINYFGNKTQCSTNCGVALKGWNNAKKYCIARKGQLPSKKDISNNSRYNKKECLSCTYWTRTEAMRFNKIKKKNVSYDPKEVLVYIPSQEEFLQYDTTLTYVATCVSN
ncbi:MAG: Unknown protein [uncultured Sulfurovum sp.]|uniref:Uncharacterized protein n=1 Tax=uncultured Sulfurovum sp. TaxID=269237 RepID=A0A6S6RSY0_9BACT|nr:MAG: Unknown protein [uncultured Sulfurovum sp.]